MRTKNIKRLFKFKIFIFLLFINFLIPAGFAQNNPKDYKIKIEFDKNINDILKKGEEKNLNQANKIKGMWEEIIRTQLLPYYFNNIELDKNDPKRLPSCVIDAMNAFLSNKKIEFTFAIPHPRDSDIFTAPDESSGAVKSGTGRMGKYDKKVKKKDDKKDDIENNKIIIYKIYQDMYYKTKEDWEADREKKEKGYCTASVLFHEMMHQALHQASMDNDLKEKFCFKIEGTEEINCFDPKTGEKYTYNAKRCTNRENMYADDMLVLEKSQPGTG